MKCPLCDIDVATCQVYRTQTCSMINFGYEQNSIGYRPSTYELQNAFNQCCCRVEKKKEDTLDKSVIALYMVAKLAMDEGLSISEFAAKYGYEFNVNDAHELMEAWLNQFKENK